MRKKQTTEIQLRGTYRLKVKVELMAGGESVQ